MCAISDPLLDKLCRTLADITEGNIDDITLKCKIVPEPNPAVLIEADTSVDPTTQRYLGSVAMRNRILDIEIPANVGAAEEAKSILPRSTSRQILQQLNIPVIMTVSERQASIVLLKLERKIIKEKEDI